MTVYHDVVTGVFCIRQGGGTCVAAGHGILLLLLGLLLMMFTMTSMTMMFTRTATGPCLSVLTSTRSFLCYFSTFF